MPIQLRPRLSCHYCGRRSKLSKKEGRRFQCDYCLAVNFFDEHGDVADVPVEETAPQQYAAESVVTGDPLANHFSAEDSIFCSTCLKNQHLYTTALSQFLPDPEDPDYDKIEAQLPIFKNGLEERYPQCCAKCEPKVRAQLNRATYNAKSDHIRRVLDKSRKQRIASRRGWRSLLVSAAGLGYALSIIFQAAWHLYGSQLQPAPIIDGLRLSQCLSERPLNKQCLNLMERFVGLSLGLGLLCVWWNPKWQHKLSNNEGKLVGLEKYYLIQLGLLLSRFAVWAILQDVPLDNRTTTIVHAVFALVFMAVALWSNMRVIQVRLALPIDWNIDPAPLLSSRQFIPPESSFPSQQTQIQERAFNLDTLSSATAPSYEPWRPPTPPNDSGESMDWTPSQPAFEPLPKTIHYLSASPSPFHGRLPALPARGVHTHSGRVANEPKEAIGLPPGFFDSKPNSILPPRQANASGEAMAQPTFFGHERQADTGLENIFETVFSFQDRSVPHSAEARVPNLRSSSQHVAEGYNAGSLSSATARDLSSQMVISGVAFFLLLVALMTWLLEVTVKPEGSSLGYYIVLASASIPTIHFLRDILIGRINENFLWLIIFAMEASSLVGLAYARGLLEGGFIDLWNKLSIAAVALLLPQEFVRMTSSCMGLNGKPRRTRSSPTVQAPTEPGTHRGSLLAQPSMRDTMSTTSAVVAPASPNLRNSNFRRDSDESTASRPTTASSSTTKRWESPNLRTDRCQWEPREKRASPERACVSEDIGGLSLNDTALRGDGRGRKDTAAPWGLPSSTTSRTFGSTPRARRGF
ncbi:uncharacterized protein A1O9_07686 [Exophiala aquamarina CBS 119918]|uniref:Ima1 N-terminal domain-containing protein n=1 Tax=Exophiala aquamarina CBS 119918 TaxID=1182545 RepID=A0A072PKQ6_9EURO|nr:uncharacterized protein A1O9_07686 [Exophiala aquamarina CBS 119918]KEF56105.1 hypothetical protein A1O9_07686 [Exophiala aquamarina CBS 119918]